MNPHSSSSNSVCFSIVVDTLVDAAYLGVAFCNVSIICVGAGCGCCTYLVVSLLNILRMKRSTKTVYVVVALLVLVAGCCSETIKHDSVSDSSSEEESWTEWAKDKISDGLGFASEATIDAAKNTKDKVADTAKYGYDSTIDASKNTKDKVMDAAKKTNDQVTDTFTGSAEYASDKAGDIKEATERKAKEGYEAAEDTKDVIASNLQAPKDKSKEIKDDVVGRTTTPHRDEEL